MGAAGLDSDDDDDKVDAGGVNRVGSVVGSNLQRPIGSKAAKAHKKEVDNNTQKVLEMRGDFTLYVSQARRREEFLEMIELAKYYRTTGDREMARQTNIDLQALIARNRLAREEEKKKEEASKSTSDKTSSTSPEESTAVTTVPSVIDLGKNQERNRGASPTNDFTGIELPPDVPFRFAVIPLSSVITAPHHRDIRFPSVMTMLPFCSDGPSLSTCHLRAARPPPSTSSFCCCQTHLLLLVPGTPPLP
jgi:hypothetical protein